MSNLRVLLQRSRHMPQEHPDSDDQASRRSSTAPVVIALLVFVALMTWSALCTGPSGQHLGFWGFVLFWLRELILVVPAVVCLLVILVGWIIKLARSHTGTAEHRR